MQVIDQDEGEDGILPRLEGRTNRTFSRRDSTLRPPDELMRSRLPQIAILPYQACETSPSVRSRVLSSDVMQFWERQPSDVPRSVLR